jgi:hypothetical protein
MIDKNQPENVEHFKWEDSMATNYARCPREIKYRIAMVKKRFNKKKKVSPANWI